MNKLFASLCALNNDASVFRNLVRTGIIFWNAFKAPSWDCGSVVQCGTQPTVRGSSAFLTCVRKTRGVPWGNLKAVVHLLLPGETWIKTQKNAGGGSGADFIWPATLSTGLAANVISLLIFVLSKFRLCLFICCSSLILSFLWVTIPFLK